jgi:putative hydrolase of the HAD superfamily
VPELVDRLSARLGLSPQAVRRVIEAVPAELQPLPGTVEIIRRLREAGRPLYYLSNMPAPYAEHLETAYPFHEWFDDGVFSSRVRLIKPDPAIFEHARRKLELEPSRTLFIDDSPANVEAARRAGWQALRFHDPEQLASELGASGWL